MTDKVRVVDSITGAKKLVDCTTSRSGSSDSGKFVQLDSNGYIDPSFIEVSANIVLTNIVCASAVAVGNWVYMDASEVAQQADNGSAATSNVLGVCTSKQSATECTVRVLGITADLFAGLDVTKEYFLGTSGGITTTPPTATGTVMLKIGQPFSATKMFVQKGQRVIRS